MPLPVAPRPKPTRLSELKESEENCDEGLFVHITWWYNQSVKRILLLRTFVRWKEKHGLSDQSLVKAVAEMEQGLIDADLGGSVLKKRVALPGRGKRGGVRVIVATQKGNRWVFLYGFEKNERDNISDRELKIWLFRRIRWSKIVDKNIAMD